MNNVTVSQTKSLSRTIADRRFDFFVMVAVLLVARAAASMVLPVYDDAFITFRYARNLAAGFGFVYQPGQWVLGVTAPLFGIFLSLLYYFGLSVPQTVIALNILLDAFIFTVTILCMNDDNDSVVLPLFVIFFGVSPIMNRICVGGMEMNVFLFVSLIALFLYQKGFRYSALCLAAISYFIRPEALILVGVIILVEMFSVRKRRVAFHILLAGAVIVPFLLILHFYYGSVLPQSVLSKSREIGSSVVDVSRTLIFSDVVCSVLVPFALYGIVRSFRRNLFVRVVTLWMIGYAAAYLLVRPHVWSWYGEPIHYAEFLLGAVGIADLIRRIGFYRVAERWSWKLGAVAILCVWCVILFRVGRSHVTESVYGGIQSWSREKDLSKDTILAGDIGVIGYYSSGCILDPAGLTWPEALSFTSLRDIAVTRRPNYLFLNATRSNALMMNERPLDSLYSPLRRFSPENYPIQNLRPEELSENWSQDYILYGRKIVP